MLGPLAYAVGAAARRRHRVAAALHACASTASGPIDGGAWQVIVAVTGAFGGGSDVGVADPRDGVLDVTVLPAGSRIALARRAWGLRRGTIAEQKPVEHFRGHVIELELPGGRRAQRRRRDPRRRARARDGRAAAPTRWSCRAEAAPAARRRARGA